MELLAVFWRSLVLGFSIAAPVGPIGMLCIERSLRCGAGVGLATGLGAATADGVYALIGAAGLSAVTALLSSLATPLALMGCVWLWWLAWGIWRSPSAEATRDRRDIAPRQAYWSALLLTLTNPMTILSFVAVFASLAGISRPGAREVAVMVAGMAAGSALWWLLLSFSVAGIFARCGAVVRRRFTRGCALLIAVMAGQLVWPVLERLR